MQYIKDHWELLLFVFGFGGVYRKHNEHDERMKKMEEIILVTIPKIHVDLAVIEERTKKL